MESKDELKEIDIKNSTCYYFDYVMKDRDIDTGNIYIRLKNIYINILIYDISYETFIGSKPLCIWFDKIDGFIKIYGGNRYLVLLARNCYDEICNRIKYLTSKKSGITDSINHNFTGIRITFQNVMILIKSVVNTYDDYHYNIFLEKGLYKDKSNTEYF